MSQINPTGWSEERVRKLVAEDSFSYQDIALPYGLSTGGADRSETARLVFEEDMRGKSVLDLGCRFGYFCFEALKRGAQRVVGVDVDPVAIQKARQLADILGAKVEFKVLDIEKDRIDERFDYILGLNVLHHLKNPIGVLDDLMSLTRERLILEVAALGAHDRRKLRLPPAARYFLSRSPAIVVNTGRRSRRAGGQTFFIMPSALEHLVLHHRSTFSRLDVVKSTHKGRYLAIGHRRRMGHIVVVTGPTSAGKSTTCARLKRNEIPELAARLEMGDGSRWTFVGAKGLGTLKEPVVENLLFHYDFLHTYMRNAQVPARDVLLDVLDTAERVTFLTIWTPPEVLLAQLRRGELERHTKFGVYYGLKRNLRRRHLKLEQEYKNPARVVELYRNWFDYTRTRKAEHVVVSFAEGVRLFSVEEWEEEARAYER